MCRSKPDGYFSEDFMDLVGKMLALADKRIDMDDILNHPWMANESLPTNEQLIEEFTERKKKADEANEAERLEKK